jgi:hypothetical protein
MAAAMIVRVWLAMDVECDGFNGPAEAAAAAAAGLSEEAPELVSTAEPQRYAAVVSGSVRLETWLHLDRQGERRSG